MSARSRQAGFSVLELLVVMAMVGTLSGVAVFNLRESVNPLDQGVDTVVSYLKQVKARSISTTSAYRVIPVGPSQAIAQYANTCTSTDFSVESAQVMSLPVGVQFGTNTWEVCFNSRGLPDANVLISLNGDGNTRDVEVFLGGAVGEVE